MKKAHVVIAFALAFGVSFGATLFACGSSSSSSSSSNTPPATNAATGDAAADCPLCTTNDDCKGVAGAVCAQFGGDSFCAPSCPNGSECAAGRTCTLVSAVDGTQSSVCVPQAECGDGTVNPPATTPPTSDHCGTLVGPNVTAVCHSCTAQQPCQPNGCFGGWWCNTASSKCQSPPSNCNVGDGGAYHIDAGAVTGNVDNTGGSVSRLYFAVVGDTRPPSINDTASYPTQIITSIYSDIQSSNPRPSFVVSTGDYAFASPNGSAAAAQMGLYLDARKQYAGTVFPAIGNHECTGATESNCGQGNVDGVTNNYDAFLQKFLTPIGQNSPNYVINIHATDNSWTSKFVFVAGNAWTAGTDDTWLDTALSVPTTYTFIVRHEPKNAYQAPGCAASELIMAKHPYTLAIVGHTHTYARTGKQQVTIGNGGAPLVSGTNYGYGVIGQRSDGAIQVDMIDYSSGQPDLNFRFALQPNGTAAAP